MNEAQWTKKICAELEACGADVLPIVAGLIPLGDEGNGNTGQRLVRAGKNGYADRLVTHRRGMWFLEFKGVTTRLDLRQAATARRLNKMRPGASWVVRNLSSLDVPLMEKASRREMWGRLGICDQSNSGTDVRYIGEFADGRGLLEMLVEETKKQWDELGK